MLVLGAVVADGGVQVEEVVIQHVGEESVVVGCLWSWLEVVLALLANLLIHHGNSWGWCRCRASSRRLLRCSYNRIDWHGDWCRSRCRHRCSHLLVVRDDHNLPLRLWGTRGEHGTIAGGAEASSLRIMRHL